MKGTATYPSRRRLHGSANRAALSAAILAVTAIACGSSDPPKPVGQIMLAIDTDMALPKDIDTMRIEVVTGTTLQFGGDYPLGEGKQTLPATLGILAGSNPAAPITIRVIGKQAQRARTLREAVTTVPTDRVATLRMPIEWLCTGVVKADDATSVASSCPDGLTCIAGTCASRDVDSSTLPAYHAGDVFGGGTPTGGGGCFDTTACFTTSTVATLDASSCSVDTPPGAAAGALNVAIAPATPASGATTDGICSGNRCLVPLDGDFPGGWATSLTGGRALLPSGVCDALKRGVGMTFVTSTGCATKTAASAPCGPWSSVQTPSAAVPDAGALADAAADRNAPPVARKVDCPDARLFCDATPTAGCCWEAGSRGPVYRCAGPATCGGLTNACDGNEDCGAEVCCFNVTKGGACRASCDPKLEGERCSVSTPAGSPNGCPTGKTCKQCATSLSVSGGLLAVSICVIGDTCPVAN